MANINAKRSGRAEFYEEGELCSAPLLREQLVSDRPDSGVKNLMFAVLEDAYNCFVRFSSPRSPGHQLHRDAEAWFFSSTAVGWIFAFETICDIFDLSAERIREVLRGHKHRSTPFVSSGKNYRLRSRYNVRPRGPLHSVPSRNP